MKILYGTKIPIHGYDQNDTVCVELGFPDVQSSFSNCILGKLNVEKFVFSENLIRAIDSDFFKHMSKIRYLDISKNTLGDAFAEEGYVRSVFENLKQLEVLLASYNGLRTMPNTAFENAEMLQVLDLSHNELELVTFSTDKLTALQHLDLRHNMITILDGLSLQRLNTLKLQVVNITHFKNETTKIDLDGNLITCSCKNRHYFNWTISYNETGACLLDGARKDIDRYILHYSGYLCKETIVIVVYTFLAVIELFVIIVFAWFILRERRDAELKRKIEHGIQQYKENRVNKHDMPVFFIL